MTGWRRTEPVRLYLYGILGPALVVLMAYGFITSDQMAVWGGLGAALLAVPGVEAARSKVAPWPTVAAQQRPDGSVVAGPGNRASINDGTPVDVLEARPTNW